nr:DNA-directed DNA polymerase [Tanacetum cinerariifolium]
MHTRSQSRNNFPQQEASPVIVEPLRIELPFLEDQSQEDHPPEVLMADNRTMAKLLQAPTEGYEDAIVIPEIVANNFELKHGLINLAQNKQFFGHDKEDPHAHIRYFNKITSTMRVPNVPSSSIRLMLFPFLLEGAARIWLKKEAPRSIQSWDDLVSKFINKFFPPSKTTNLRNEITRFQQRFDESFYEAWERFSDLLRACPHHRFFELHQLDTFYNALNINDQDSLNSATGGNFLDKMPREYLKIIESKSKVHQSRAKAVVAKVSMSSSTPAISSDVAELKDMVKAFLLDKKNQSPAPTPSSTPVPVKAVEPNCVTCSGAYSYQNCPATNENAYRDNIQEYVSQAATANYNQGNTGFQPQMVANQNSTPGFPPHQNNQNNFNRGTILIKTEEEISTSLISTHLLSIKTNFIDPRDTPCSQNTAPVQPSVIQSESQAPVFEPVVAPVSAPMPNLKPSIPYPSRHDNEKRRDQANEQIKKFYEIFKDMSFEISFTDALILMPKFTSTLKALIGNKEKLSEMARTPMNEHCSAVILNKLPRKLGDPGKFLIPCEFPGMDECLPLADLGASINLMPFSVCEALSLPKLTPTCLTLELTDRSVSKPIGIAKYVSFKVGVFYFPADFVVVDFEPDPRVLLILGSDFLLFEEADTFLGLEDDPDLPKINPFYYDPEGEILLLETILNSEPLPPLLNHEQYLPSYEKELKVCEAKTIKSSVDKPPEGINPEFCTHKILMEEDYKPAVQHQRRVNPKIHDVIKKEVEKLLDAGLIYPISNSLWVSPVHYIPKKGGFTVVENEENELIPTRLVTGWRVCIDYRKLNEATRKDHFPLPFMDQMFERLARNEYYCFLDGFSGYFQIPIDPRDQEKTTFTAHMARLPTVACLSACAMLRALFKVFGNSFEDYLSHLDKMLQRCEDTNLSLNWEKSHFMVKEGIVLGHKIYKNGTEVDKAKVDVIANLPHPTTVNEAPILIAPNWDLPFELMCDASDFTVGTVLGQRHEKHFKLIHYASKTMNDVKSNYTTIEKEMLAVVYAFEKFQSYLIMNKSIVHTDHSTLKYLFAKKDAKAILLRWVLLLQEFDFEVLDTKGAENLAADHLSRLENPYENVLDPKEINENFPLETLSMVTFRGDSSAPWFVDFANYHAAYKTPIGCTPYKLVYGKVFHLLIELEHKAYWALKQANFDLSVTGDHQKVQLNELNELRDHAYENSLIYKEKTKRIHDSKIKNRVFNVVDRVLLFNSRLKIFLGKLKTRWSGPFTIAKVFPYGTVELSQANGPNFKVGYRVKHYFGGDVPQLVVLDLQTFPMDN